MSLEVGKTYKTRDGRSVRVLATDRLGAAPVVALVQDADGLETVYSYQTNGRYMCRGERPLDIMIEEEYMKAADVERMFDQYFSEEWRGDGRRARPVLSRLFNELPRHKFKADAAR